MEELIQQAEETAILLYQNQERKAYENVQRILQPVQQVIQALIEVAEQQGEMEKEKEWMLNVLKCLVESYKAQDILQMADILKYEITEILKIYQEIIG